MMCNGVEVLLTAWKTQHEKLQKFISQQFSLRKDEITGMQTNFEEVSSKVILSARMVHLLLCWNFVLCLQVYQYL